MLIIRLAAKPPRRWRPLSSNVSRHHAIQRSPPVKYAQAAVAPRVMSLLSVVFALFALSAGSASAAADTWLVAGQQGLVRIVIVPMEHASDSSAYEGQIQSLCDPERTCFLNFYTNSTGVTPAVPVPDAIANEATATYRRSMKNGVQVFKWSCRMKVSTRECF